MQDFFEDMTIDLFKQGFSDLLINPNITNEDQFKCEQAFMYLKMDSEVSYIYKLIAIQKFHELISEEKQEYCLKRILFYLPRFLK